MADLTMVNELVAEGERLIDALNSGAMTVTASFWARKTGDDTWYLHLSSPFVDSHGSNSAYGVVNDELAKGAAYWIDPFAIKVLRTDDSLTEAVLLKLKPRIPKGLFAVTNPKPYPGMTVLYDTTLGGYEFDEVLIYPPRQPQTTP